MVAKKTGKQIQKGKKLTAGTLTRHSKLLRGTAPLVGGALTRPPIKLTRSPMTRPNVHLTRPPVVS